jgi:hypothetical protein
VSGSPNRLDLDAALAEETSAEEPLVVTFFGEDWELPGQLPASVLVRVARWQEDGLVDDEGEVIESGELTASQLLLLLADMVPDAILDEWFARGLTAPRFPAAVKHIMASYQLVNQADQMAGKARPRTGNRATRRSSAKSSNAGQRSKRTSTASTRSRTSSRS